MLEERRIVLLVGNFHKEKIWHIFRLSKWNLSFFFLDKKLKITIHTLMMSKKQQIASLTIPSSSLISGWCCGSQYRGLYKWDVWERGKERWVQRWYIFLIPISQFLNYFLHTSFPVHLLNVYSLVNASHTLWNITNQPHTLKWNTMGQTFLILSLLVALTELINWLKAIYFSLINTSLFN